MEARDFSRVSVHRYKNNINEANLLDLKAYLSSISTYILNVIFGSGDGVRIHFRYYSHEDNGYQMLIAVSNGSNRHSN